jgi:aspartate aminotransferase
LRAAITPRTRALILNTPNNPTGRVYPAQRSARFASPCWPLSGSAHYVVLSDEPYKSFVYDGKRQHEVASEIANTVPFATRGPSLWDCRANASATWRSRRAWWMPSTLRAACAFSNRTLGFINAPAIWQWVILETADATVDAAPYERRRNVLCDALR